jgi:hypothetical protein
VKGEGVKDSEIILANMNRFNPSFVKFSEEEIMKRNLVLTMMALVIAIMGVLPVNAQDLDFTAVPKITVGLTNQGAIGGLLSNGSLGASTPSALTTFRANDVAVAGGAIFSVGSAAIRDITGNGLITAADREAVLIRLAGFGEGTFALPQAIPLAGFNAFSLVVTDIDLDGLQDVAIAEDLSSIEVFTGAFLQAGILTTFDRNTFNAAVNGPAFGPILTETDGDTPLSITAERLNGDAFSDLAYVTDASTVELVLSTLIDLSGDGIPETPAYVMSTNALGAGTLLTNPIALPGQLGPRRIDAEVLNIEPVLDAGVDATPDLAVATIAGIQLITTIPDTTGLADPTFAEADLLPAGTNPIGVVLADITRDNLVDVIALNAGSGNISTNIASAGGGYGNAIRTVPVGQNPVSLTLINFNNDGIPDVAVASAGAVTTAGAISVLQGNGQGGFTLVPGRQLTGVARPTSVAAGALRAGSQGEDLVIGTTNAGVNLLGGSIRFLANTAAGFSVVRVKVFSAVSLASTIDRTGAGNDVVVIEQNLGVVFILLNVSGGAAAPQVAAIDLNDVFTLGITSPTSATPFRDAQTNLTNIAVTDITNPTNTSGFGQLVILLNDGTGTFTDFFSFRQFPATDGATNILNGDMNLDGNDDLVYIDTKVNAAFVTLNDGANFFLRTTFQESGAFVPVTARLGDVNDDDRLDLVVGHQGALGVQANQSIVTTLFGDGTGRLQPTGPQLQVPNFALSLVGGVANFETNNIPRIVDFNGDGFPDFAVATTRGGGQNIVGAVPTVTLLLNRGDSPGNFNVSTPIALIDDTAPLAFNLQLEGIFGGPGVVSGRNGDPTSSDAGIGIGFGGANYVMSVADFNADGSPDLCVSGATLVDFDIDDDTIGDDGSGLDGIPGVPALTNFRASIFLFGNETASTVRVARPLRAPEYTLTGNLNPFFNGGDTFVANATGNFLALNNFVPDVFHISINGNLWVDVNTSSLLNHAPIVTIARADLNAPIGQGRKVIITSGETTTVRVTAADVDSDTLRFSLVPTPTGERPPSFISINETTGQITINSADINRGPGVATFRIAVEATDAPSTGTGTGAGARQPLTGRDYFTLIVNPNRPPTIAPIPVQNAIAGTPLTVTLNVVDPDPNSTVTSTVTCDRGSFVTLSGNTLSINAGPGDVGTTTCTVTSRDQFGLSAVQTFTIVVTAANRAPQLGNIADVTLRGGEVRSITVTATDPDPNDRLTLSLQSAPAFVSLADNGNGTGTIRVAPGVTDTTGGRVTVSVRDNAGATSTTSFNITVNRAVVINAVSRAKPNLFISGIFGASGNTVTINGTNVSARIIGQNENSITLKGSNRKLGLRSGPNQITVTSGGVTSSAFVLNLLSDED